MNNRKHNGFTIIELMVTLAVAAIVATLAAPNMADFYQRNRLNSYTFDYVGAIAFARSEAVTRGESVTFRSVATNSWAEGWQVVLTSEEVIRQGESFPTTAYSLTLEDSDDNALYSFSISARGQRTGTGNLSLEIDDGKNHTKSYAIPIYGSPISQ